MASGTLPKANIPDTNTGVRGALSEGEVLADDGKLYTTVQAAENAADSYIFIGPGTFTEAVTIDTAGLTVQGSGRGTVIDGAATGSAITINAANVEVRELAVQTTAGGGNAYDGIATAANADSVKIRDVWVLDADQHGINLGNGGDHLVTGCEIEGADNHGIRSSAVDDTITTNRVEAAGDDGINISGTDQLVTQNRISGSATSDLDDSSATTPVVANNVTGAAN